MSASLAKFHALFGSRDGVWMTKFPEIEVLDE
jgi:hypothetical protein